MYDRGLAIRFHELTTTLLDPEKTRIFGGLAYVKNSHICFDLWGDYLVIHAGNESARKLVEDDDLQNYIYIAILFTRTLPPKTAKRAPTQNGHLKERTTKLINSA